MTNNESECCPKFGACNEILLWKDVKKTGIVFGVGFLFFWLVVVMDYTVLSLLSSLALFHLVVAFVWTWGLRFVASIQHSGKIAVEEREHKEYLSAEFLSQHAACVAGFFNETTNKVIDIYTSASVVGTFQLGAILFGLRIVGCLFDALTLAFLAFVAAFSLPLFYSKNQKLVDSNIALVKSLVWDQAKGIYEKVMTKIPKASDLKKDE